MKLSSSERKYERRDVSGARRPGILVGDKGRFSLALSNRGSNLRDEHPVVSSSLSLNGRAFMHLGEYQEAKDAFEECLSIRLRKLPEDQRLLATTKS